MNLAQRLLNEIETRGATVWVEYCQEIVAHRPRQVARLAIKGRSHRPGDFERLNRHKTAIVAILVARGAIADSQENDGASVAITSDFARKQPRHRRILAEK